MCTVDILVGGTKATKRAVPVAGLAPMRKLAKVQEAQLTAPIQLHLEPIQATEERDEPMKSDKIKKIKIKEFNLKKKKRDGGLLLKEVPL